MRHAISKNMREFIAVIVMIIIALFVGGFILSHQRFYLPAWFPVIGTDFFELKAEFSTAQSVTPGQGQTVDIAGVPVGEIKRVELEDGRAVVTMSIRDKYKDLVKRDATMLLRPKTGLKDMVIELDPGTPGTPAVPEGYTVPVSQTRPDVNLDEILSNLDRDTRDYLRLLVAGGGEALKDNGHAFRTHSAASSPSTVTSRSSRSCSPSGAVNLARLIHNLQLLVTEVGTKDKELARAGRVAERRVRGVREPGQEPAGDVPAASGHAARDELRARRSRTSSPRCWVRRCASCAPARARSTTRSARPPTSPARPFRRSRIRSGRSRGTHSRPRRPCAPRPATWQRSFPSSRRPSTC